MVITCCIIITAATIAATLGTCYVILQSIVELVPIHAKAFEDTIFAKFFLLGTTFLPLSAAISLYAAAFAAWNFTQTSQPCLLQPSSNTAKEVTCGLELLQILL